ncbi:lon protease Lon1 [Schizosaccharomyces cryophilus OY26]|uniref:Lon protease homolog, mitochondrial n=1 Tax=Schizosaccharomyces cryophilus (strain OY26 / ATCC MYA-4695 / CBS 11777 / NBRC 106824 / NRRL Y48691) TaxID=653667 RepID=S9XKF9_SCHCR|nr:lon protease Lon1 [Schizosaccharomyces cryophilus OY26]EPY54201.1 lon protease Lon1 [Schizosaccharomyces cryophilus OY26]
MITRLPRACLRRSGAYRWKRELYYNPLFSSQFSTSCIILHSNIGPFRYSQALSRGRDSKNDKLPKSDSEAKKAPLSENESSKQKELQSHKQTLKKNSERKKDEENTDGSKAFFKPSSNNTKNEKEQANDSSKLDSSEKKKDSSKNAIPEIYPQLLALPIVRRPLFPGFYKAIVTKDPSVSEAIKELIKKRQPYIGAFLHKDENADTDVITDINQVYPVGVFAQITSIFPTKNAGETALTAVLYPHRRIRITELLPPKYLTNATADIKEAKQVGESKELTIDDKSEDSSDVESTASMLQDYNVSVVNVENVHNLPFSRQNPVIKALAGEIMSTFKEIATLSHIFREQIANFSISQGTNNVFDEPARLADFTAAVCSTAHQDLQGVLEAQNIEERLEKALIILKQELTNAQLQSKISRDVEQKLSQRQKEFILMEQMKGIKRELGHDDPKESLVNEFKRRSEESDMPEHVMKVFKDELSKFQHLEPMAAEYNVTRNYLDWITQLPWGKKSAENFDIQHARSILDRDHYGLKDVKDRILELVAVGKLRGTMQGRIICLVGPPGVGKTSVGKSIASALHREFFRFSVGGLTDVAEIKGHRRTYIGAMPGKIVQALKKVQTENPLILIDEIDKVGKSHQGDPHSALLELLDSEQNSAFLDHYMDMTLDVSSALFVCTANTIDTIPPPLLDRMEVIEVSGYVEAEKLHIARDYLIPQTKINCGLKDANVSISDDAIRGLIQFFCHESGVRNLKKSIEKIFRKTSYQIVEKIGDKKETNVQEAQQNSHKKKEDEAEATDQADTSSVAPLSVPKDMKVNIDEKDLINYLGPPIHTSPRLYDTTPAGVVMGLAWTPMGGVPMYVETIVKNLLSTTSAPSLERTGQLGDVMKESSELSYSFSKSFLFKNFPNNKFFEHARLHMHCPEGSISKDGPSAGITMATSLLSLALSMPVPATTAMTGELTLTGKVLRIGGLREKAVAAKLSGVKEIMFPKGNIADWEQLPDYVKEGLTGVPVEWYDDVFKRIFPHVNAEECNNLWPTLTASASS